MTDAHPLSRRALLGSAACAAGAWPLVALAQKPTFRLEDFGAHGDGRADDTRAFQALGRAVSEYGSGTITLRPGATYRVGQQTRGSGGDPAYVAQSALRIIGANGLTILGNGATIRLNDGLRYGSFDPVTGARFDPPKGKFTNRRYAAIVGALIEIRSSRGIRVSDLVLDGNMDRLVVGGRWETDIQLQADGLHLVDVGEVDIADVVSRNNGRDGVYLRGRGHSARDALPDAIHFKGVRCLRNGRQGVSVVGGSGIRFTDCVFADTGQGPVASAPEAGVDIEPNGRNWATNLLFEQCEFINNRGVGLAAPQGASHGIVVRGCTFWQGFAPGRSGRGSGDAFWLVKPGVLIETCRVHGSVTNLARDALVRRTSFDDAVHPLRGRSAQRRKYLLAGAGGSFIDCTFAVTGPKARGLIYSVKSVAFRRCRMRYAGATPGKAAVAVFGPGAMLEDVTFSDALTDAARGHIHSGGATLRGRVIVTGPGIRWGSRDGPIGDVGALGSR